jgi:hypothetical protein
VYVCAYKKRDIVYIPYPDPESPIPDPRKPDPEGSSPIVLNPINTG